MPVGSIAFLGMPTSPGIACRIRALEPRHMSGVPTMEVADEGMPRGSQTGVMDSYAICGSSTVRSDFVNKIPALPIRQPFDL